MKKLILHLITFLSADMKKISLILIAFVTCSLAANAATDYGIEVNGTKITSDKLSFSIGSGSVKYNVSTNTLTISNVEIWRAGDAIKIQDNTNRNPDANSQKLNIKFTGTNSITSTVGAGILTEGSHENEVIVITVTGTTTINGLSAAVHIKEINQQSRNISFEGSGTLNLNSEQGCGVLATPTNSTVQVHSGVSFEIANINIGGKYGNIYDLPRIYFHEVNDQVELSTTITLLPTKGADYPHIKGQTINFGTDVHIELPSDLHDTDPVNLEFGNYYDKTFIINDDRDNPNSGYYSVNNYLYAISSFYGADYAELKGPKKIYKRSKPTELSIPGYVKINGTWYPVGLGAYSLSSMYYAKKIWLNYGVTTIGDCAMTDCFDLIEVHFPSSVLTIGESIFGSSSSSSLNFDLYWSTLDVTKTSMESNSFSGCQAKTMNAHFSTRPVVAQAKTKTSITNNMTVNSTPAPERCYDCRTSFQDGTYICYIVDESPFIRTTNGSMSLIGSTKSAINDRMPLETGGNKYYPKKVAPEAFYNNKNITEIDLTGYTEIGENAFYGCSNTRKLTLGEDITSMGESPFASMTALDTVNWNIKTWSNFTYDTRPFKNSAKNISSFKFGDNVKSIPAYLCYNMSKLNTLTIPKSMTYLGMYAFKGCTGLKTINWYAIDGRYPLAEVNEETDLPFWEMNNVTTINIGHSVQYIQRSLFAGMSGLKTLTLGTSLKEIEESAFYQCSSLTSVNFPSSLLSIKQYAFYQSGLTSVTIPANVNNVEQAAFSQSNNLTKVNWNTTKITETNAPFSNCQALNTFVFVNGLTKVPNAICSGLPALTSVTIPSTVTEIGASAFASCTALKSITLPQAVKTIGPYALYNCKSLSSFAMPNQVTEIGEAAFAVCSALKSISLPQSLQTIGRNAFNSSGLTSITIPKSVTTIDYGTFAACTALKSVSLPQGLKIIGDGAFYQTALTSVTIPSLVNSIGRQAFANCTTLANIYPKMTAPADLTYGEQIFEGVNKQTCKLGVPKGTLAKYKATMPWKEFYNITETAGLPGDVNGDGKVNVSDVSALINMILGVTPMDQATGDVNGDGRVNVSDVSALINIILGIQ